MEMMEAVSENSQIENDYDIQEESLQDSLMYMHAANNNSNYYYDAQMSQEHLLYWYYINGLAGTAIAIFGLLGNTVSILVLTRRTMRNSTSVLLIFMGIFDNVFLLLNLLLQTFPLIFRVHDICHEYIDVRQFLFRVSSSVLSIKQNTSFSFTTYDFFL